jgi:gluconate 2-dehydrogenase gamma chain
MLIGGKQCEEDEEDAVCYSLGVPRLGVRRRQFLGMGVAAAGGGTAVSCLSSRVDRRWRFFTPAEARTVDAICELLVPGDQDPGAREAGVVHYIDLQLTRHFKGHQRAYRLGLAAVDRSARGRFGRAFADLSADSQMAVLHEVEKTARPFFDLILAHTMQGFYGDPRHGGNRDAVSWKMLGLAFPPVRGRAH